MTRNEALVAAATDSQRQIGIVLPERWSIWNMGGDCLVWGRAYGGNQHWFQIQHPDDLMLPESAADVHVLLMHDDIEDFVLDFRGTLADALAWVDRCVEALRRPVDMRYALLTVVVDAAPIASVRSFLDGFHGDEWPHDGSDATARSLALQTLWDGIETKNVESLLAARNLISEG